MHILKRSGVINCVFYRVLCICGNQTYLATGSLDRIINIWLLKDGKLCQTLIGHTKGVWSVKFLNSILLISGSYDATIKVED
jgi:F-box/WD-40 domain protein MET30